jgi:carbon-monoxide dehydrogenase medium subunit
MYDNAEISAAYPGLMDAARLIGGVQIQGRASMGGNLCNASPAADSIPALIAHSAICHIAGPNGRSEVAVEDFCVAPGRTVLRGGEFLVYMQIPAPKPGFGAAYLRFIPRNEMDIAVVGAGVSVVLDESRTKIVEARVALGAVGPTPIFAQQASESLLGKSIGTEVVDAAARTARAETSCISDMRGTADFRRHLSEVLTRRALNIAIDRAKAA